MSDPTLEDHPSFTLIGGGERNSQGNLVFHQEQDELSRVLKVYRRRKGLRRELIAGFSHRLFERKRGVSSQERCETERRSLDLWTKHGFDVLRRYDEPLPDWVDPGCGLWMEYAPGRRLHEVLADPKLSVTEKEELVSILAVAHHARHLLALELENPLLLQEHATIKHTLYWEGRLITFDLEGGYKPNYPVLKALGQELAGVLRSLWRGGGPCFAERLPQVYLDAYENFDLLDRASESFLRGALLVKQVRRFTERRRRGGRSKIDLMEQLRARLADRRREA